MTVAGVDVGAALASAGVPPLTEERLREWMADQRWYAAKVDEVCEVTILDVVPLIEETDKLLLLLVEVRPAAGTHDLYQLLVGVGPAREDDDGAAFEICRQDGMRLYDGLSDGRQGGRIGALIAADATIEHEATTVAFRRNGSLALGPDAEVRVVDAEQSNSSLVLDEAHIIKAFRRLQPGLNPEIEMLRFLDRHGFANMVPLEGWYEYRGELLEASLGVMQRFVTGAHDGWELVLERIAQQRGEELILPLRDLGSATAAMHSLLGSDSEDPEFAPEHPPDEQVALLTATIDEQIEQLFVNMPARAELEPITGRIKELRDVLSLLSHTGTGGMLIRIHGDYHLGQTLLTAGGWVVIDFEGEPARPLRERRRKRSPLRDVAGMLRSISYACLVSEVLHGVAVDREWEPHARQAFLDGYMERIDLALLPAGAQAVAKLLAIFELEKAIYELRYELQNRPDWLGVPVLGIERLLDGQRDAA
jgi:trehalose synthase-fused probable maltokinase